MGRPPLPSHLHLINGNPGKRARNAREPEPDLLLDLEPPEHLTAEAAKVWRQLAPALRKARLLTVIDAPMLEITCDAIATFRAAAVETAQGKSVIEVSNSGAKAMSPWAMVKSMAAKQAMAALREFGASPSARSRVMVDPQADLFGRQGTGTDGGSHYDA